MIVGTVAAVILAIIVVGLLVASVRVVRPDERGVVFRRGRPQPGIREPGKTLIVPTIDRLQRIPMGTQVADAAVEEMVTRDHVTTRVGVVVHVRVVDPVKVSLNVADHLSAVSQSARASLQSFVGHCDFGELAGSDREVINSQLREVIAEATENPWGLRIEQVEIVVPDARAQGNSPAGR